MAKQIHDMNLSKRSWFVLWFRLNIQRKLDATVCNIMQSSSTSMAAACWLNVFLGLTAVASLEVCLAHRAVSYRPLFFGKLVGSVLKVALALLFWMTGCDVTAFTAPAGSSRQKRLVFVKEFIFYLLSSSPPKCNGFAHATSLSQFWWKLGRSFFALPWQPDKQTKGSLKMTSLAEVNMGWIFFQVLFKSEILKDTHNQAQGNNAKTKAISIGNRHFIRSIRRDAQ